MRKSLIFIVLFAFLVGSASAISFSYSNTACSETSFNNFTCSFNSNTLYTPQQIQDAINLSGEKAPNIFIKYVVVSGASAPYTYFVNGKLIDYSIPKNKLFNPWYNTSYDFKVVFNISNPLKNRIINITTPINRSDVFVNETDNSLIPFYNNTNFAFVNLSAGSGNGGNYTIAKYVNKTNAFAYAGNISNISVADWFTDKESASAPTWKVISGGWSASLGFLTSTGGGSNNDVIYTNFTNTTVAESVNQSFLELNYTFNLSATLTTNFQIMVANNSAWVNSWYTSGCVAGENYYEVAYHSTVKAVRVCKSGTLVNMMPLTTSYAANTNYTGSLRINSTGIRYTEGESVIGEVRKNISTINASTFNRLAIFSFQTIGRRVDNITAINYTEPVPTYNQTLVSIGNITVLSNLFINTWQIAFSDVPDNITWYINGTSIQTNFSVGSASYTNSSPSNGTWNITAIGYYGSGQAAIKTWIWQWLQIGGGAVQTVQEYIQVITI